MSEDKIVRLAPKSQDGESERPRPQQIGEPGKKVFISHSTVDRSTVELIVERLTANGIDVWISHKDIDGQAQYSEQIERAIRECIAIVVVISRASNSSPEVLKEVELGLKSRRAILPVVIEAGERPQGGLAYHLSAHNWLPWHSSPQQVIDNIRETVDNAT